MTEKDLKKLNRYQLLELLIAQTEQVNTLQKQLDETQKALEVKELRLASLGSIAEASLELTNIFQAAQEAADLYVNSAKKFAKDIESAAYEEAASILAKAQVRTRFSTKDKLDEVSHEEASQTRTSSTEYSEEGAETGTL